MSMSGECGRPTQEDESIIATALTRRSESYVDRKGLYGAKASRGGDGPVWLEAGIDQDILDDDAGVLPKSLPARRSLQDIYMKRRSKI